MLFSVLKFPFNDQHYTLLHKDKLPFNEGPLVDLSQMQTCVGRHVGVVSDTGYRWRC